MLLSVQKNYCRIQISGKRDPKGVGNLKICRYPIYLFIGYHRFYNAYQQKDYTNERGNEFPRVEEYQTPRKIEKETYLVNIKRSSDGFGHFVLFVIYNSGADTHEDVKDSPYDRE